MRSIFFSVILISGTISMLSGQPNVRLEDHFWRKRVVNRISMVEKVNKPLVQHSSEYYGAEGAYTEKDGMVASLINGLKQGKYVAYDPEDWNKVLNYEDLLSKMKEFGQAFLPAGEDDWGEGDENFDEIIDDWDSSQWEIEGANEKDWATPYDDEFGDNGGNQGEAEIDLAPYEEVVHLVEDWIFDKTRSEMVQVMDFFEIIWSDPSGTLPEKVLARFKWKDIKDQLDQTMWKTRFNDAEARSVAEVFELRIFHSFLIDVGGEPIRSLQEAERRRQEIIEFEHHLWSY